MIPGGSFFTKAEMHDTLTRQLTDASMFYKQDQSVFLATLIIPKKLLKKDNINGEHHET